MGENYTQYCLNLLFSYCEVEHLFLCLRTIVFPFLETISFFLCQVFYWVIAFFLNSFWSALFISLSYILVPFYSHAGTLGSYVIFHLNKFMLPSEVAVCYHKKLVNIYDRSVLLPKLHIYIWNAQRNWVDYKNEDISHLLIIIIYTAFHDLQSTFTYIIKLIHHKPPMLLPHFFKELGKRKNELGKK